MQKKAKGTLKGKRKGSKKDKQAHKGNKEESTEPGGGSSTGKKAEYHLRKTHGAGADERTGSRHERKDGTVEKIFTETAKRYFELKTKKKRLEEESIRIQTVLDCTNEELSSLETILGSGGKHIYEHFEEANE